MYCHTNTDKMHAVALSEAANNSSKSWMCTLQTKNQINVHIMFYKQAMSDIGLIIRQRAGRLTLSTESRNKHEEESSPQTHTTQ